MATSVQYFLLSYPTKFNSSIKDSVSRALVLSDSLKTAKIEKKIDTKNWNLCQLNYESEFKIDTSPRFFAERGPGVLGPFMKSVSLAHLQLLQLFSGESPTRIVQDCLGSGKIL